MTLTEIVGLVLAVIGVAFAFETPRHWFLRVAHLRRPKPPSPLRPDPVRMQSQFDSSPVASTGARFDELPTASSLAVQEIVDAINSAPPLQRDERSRHYDGIIVEWIGYLRRADPDPRDRTRVRVNLIVDKSRSVGYSFWFSEVLERIPELKTLQANSKLRVKGRIVSASGPGLSVDLEPSAIDILERSVA